VDLGGDPDPGTLLELALRCYDVERYDTALAALEHLEVHAPNPTVVFNLGAVHAAMGQCREAKHYYRRYLDQTQSESGREEARQQLEILGDCSGPAASEPAASEPPALGLAVPSVTVEPPLASAERPAKTTSARASLPGSPDGNEPSVSRVATWVMFGGSAAFLLASGGLAYAGERQERRSAPSQRGDVIASAESEGLRYNSLAWACAGGALALASSGLLLLAFEPREGTQVSVRTGDARAMGLSLEHQF
jgi:hypothetical protein